VVSLRGNAQDGELEIGGPRMLEESIDRVLQKVRFPYLKWVVIYVPTKRDRKAAVLANTRTGRRAAHKIAGIIQKLSTVLVRKSENLSGTGRKLE